MCGEHGWDCDAFSEKLGSSPHVRGAQRHQSHCGRPAGIIPACAGSTVRFGACYLRVRDHPRMCGEHADRETEGCACPGSSPHVRGAPSSALTTSSSCGIIPACAGSTNLQGIGIAQWRDHPRMCGEHRPCSADRTPGTGSSPHVRGAHELTSFSWEQCGIIPACAGSTFYPHLLFF